jgi:hypothetical protein
VEADLVVIEPAAADFIGVAFDFATGKRLPSCQKNHAPARHNRQTTHQNVGRERI